MKSLRLIANPSRRGMIALLAALAVACGLLAPISAAAESDPLPSWNDGAAKQAILAFVADTTTTEGLATFVPPAERIASFDQDGTLWVEHPLYTQVVYSLDHVGDLVKEKPELKDRNVLVASDRVVPKLIEHPTLFQPSLPPQPDETTVAVVVDTQGSLTSESQDDAQEEPAAGAEMHITAAELLGSVSRDGTNEPSLDGPNSSSVAELGSSAPLRILVTRRTQRDRIIGVRYLLSSLTRMHNFTHVHAEHRTLGLGEYADGMIEHDAQIGKILDYIDQTWPAGDI